MSKVGKQIQDILTSAKSANHIVLSELPNDDVGAFTLTKGDQEGLTSLLIMFFINYPELFISTVAVMTRIFVDAGQDMAGKLATDNRCNCPRCQERRAKKESGSEDTTLEDFTVTGQYKN